MENDIPKIDLPDDWIIGNLSHKDIGLLSLYANYPCRLKAEIFVLCMQGEIEASINLTRYQVKPGSFITILPGTILQIHKVEGDLQIYFMGFSSEFTNHANIGKSAMDMLYVVKDSPIIELKEQPAQLLKDYFSLLVKTYGFCGPKLNKDILNHLLSGVLLGVGAMYKDKTLNKTNLSKAEQISKNFNHLVMQNYTTQRSVAVVCQETRHNSGASQHDCQADDRQDLCRDHHLYGDHGCEGTVEIDRPIDPRHRLFAEFHEYVFLRQIFQAACGDGAVGIPEQLKTKVPGRWVISASPTLYNPPCNKPQQVKAPARIAFNPGIRPSSRQVRIDHQRLRDARVFLFRKGIDGKQTAASLHQTAGSDQCGQILARTVVRQPDKITVGTDGDIRVLVQIAVKKFLPVRHAGCTVT